MLLVMDKFASFITRT